MRHTKRFTFATAGLGITVLMLGWALPGLTATPAADGGRGAAHGSPACRGRSCGPSFCRSPEGVRRHSARLRGEPPADGPPREVLRSRGPLRVLRDPRRAHALPDQGQAGAGACVGAPVPEPQSGRDRHRHEPHAWHCQLSRRQEPGPVADGALPLRPDRLSRPLAEHRPAPARERWRPEVRVPRAPGRASVRHPPGVRRRQGSGSRCRRSTSDPDGGRSAPGRRPGVLPDDHWPTGAGEQPLPARGWRQEQGATVRLRRRFLPTKPRVGHRSRRPVHHLPRRQQRRDRGRHRRRRQRQLLHRRHDPVAQLPDHDRGVQAHRRDQQLR